jgi:predicted transcriptional regulator
MKTTIEIPDVLFRRVKSKAAERSQTLKEFVSQALQEKLASRRSTARSGEPEWMQGFGTLRHLHKETERIRERIHEAFEVVEPEDRA